MYSPTAVDRREKLALFHGESANAEIDRRALLQQQQRLEQGDGILAARNGDGDAVAVADHLEAMNRFADFPQQGLFEVHWHHYRVRALAPDLHWCRGYRRVSCRDSALPGDRPGAALLHRRTASSGASAIPLRPE